jgi:hypothetical protein
MACCLVRIFAVIATFPAARSMASHAEDDDFTTVGMDRAMGSDSIGASPPGSYFQLGDRKSRRPLLVRFGIPRRAAERTP